MHFPPPGTKPESSIIDLLKMIADIKSQKPSKFTPLYKCQYLNDPHKKKDNHEPQ